MKTEEKEDMHMWKLFESLSILTVAVWLCLNSEDIP